MVTEIKRGSQIWLRKKKGVSNMVTEINYGSQKWLSKQIGVSKMVKERKFYFNRKSAVPGL